MTVGRLKEILKDIPDDLNVFVEGNEANAVCVEGCQGNQYVRIFKAWDVTFRDVKFISGYREEK